MQSTSRMELHEIESYLHNQIPLTRAMGLQVRSGEGGRLVLEAPLELNHNHLGTAFGGSLSALATVAGYCFLWLQLGDPTAHVVIRDSAIRYFRPVRGPMRATCHPPEPEALATFLEQFQFKGKARASLRVTIDEDSATAVEFQGTFVAIRPR